MQPPTTIKVKNIVNSGVGDESASIMKSQLSKSENTGAQGNSSISTRQEKFAEFLRTEKLRKYKRAPRVYG